MLKSNYLKLIVLYISFSWFASFSRTVLPTHFLNQGLTLSQILFGVIMCFLGILFLLIIKFSNVIQSRLAWRLSMISVLAYMLLVFSVGSLVKFYLASFIYGFSVFFFFIFYNVAHFRNTPREKTGHSSAIMFSVGPIVSIGAPLLAGVMAKTNLNLIWIFSVVFFLIAFYLAGYQKNFTVKYEVMPALREIKSLRSFIFLEGVWGAMIFGIMPIYTLFFIKTPLEYGVYLAYLSLASVIANLLLGRVTDKIQKRSVFLYPITLSMAVITFLFAFATPNVILWVIVSGAIQFVLPLFQNISTAMVVDTHPDLDLAMPGREIVLNTGRIVGLSLTFLSFYFEKTPHYIFIFLGLMMILYPLSLFWKTKLKKQYAYL